MSRRHWRSRSSLAAALTVIGLLTPVGSATGAASGPSAAQQIPLEDIVVTSTQVVPFGLRRPTSITSAGDGSGRLFITEKTGTVRIYHPDTGLATNPLFDIGELIDFSQNERGLLGLAPAPDFATSQTVYVAYTRIEDGAVTLARVPLASPVPEVLITQEHATFANHNGGQLAFGHDGYLYWSIGDGGGAGDPFGSGQSLETLRGKIMRVDVSHACGELPYCVPEDNPFVGTAGARGEIWAYGLRNPWRFSFDAADGSLWIADVGQGASEEIDHTSTGGENFGWSCREGTELFNEERCDPGATYTEPVFAYPNPELGCSVIGGYVYHGQEFADIADGTYVATDYCSNAAFGVRANPDGTHTSATLGGEFPIQVTTFGVDDAGELYVANDLPGQLHRIGFELAGAAR